MIKSREINKIITKPTIENIYQISDLVLDITALSPEVEP